MILQPFFPIPLEITHYILSFLRSLDLCRVSAVNKKANILALNILNKPNVGFRNYLNLQPYLTDQVIEKALQLFPTVNEIEIEAEEERMQLTGGSLNRINSVCLRLRGFHLRTLHVETYKNFINGDLLSFLQGKRGLRRLTLQGCSEISHQLSEIPELCPHLDELRVDSPYLTDEFVEKVVTYLPRLRKLDLGSSLRITEKSLDLLCNKPLSLNHLELRVFSFPFTEEKIKLLISHMKNLKGFGLQGCQQVTDEVIKLMVMHHPNLEYLYLFGCKITKKAVELLAKGTLKLEVLHLNDCSKEKPILKELEIQRKKERFKCLKSAQILGYWFWHYGYPVYMERAKKLGLPVDFHKQAAFIYFKEEDKQKIF